MTTTTEKDRIARETRQILVDCQALLADDTAESVRAAGGAVIAAACLVHRGNVDASGIGVPEYVYLLEYEIPD